MNYMKNIVKHITVMLVFLVSIGMFAQIDKTYGTRITDVTTEKKESTAAILDLDSSTKGFYMPRMNTAQRDDFTIRLKDEAAEGKRNTGMAIYNTTNDCIEYWHAATEKWRSLCGSLPPAKLDFVTDCSNIQAGGISIPGLPGPSWQQGRPFDPDVDTFPIRVYVSQIGTYTIIADSGNGYFFTAEGQFQAEGNYTVYLKGMGSPKKGYDQTGTGKKGDKLVFSFNGLPSQKCAEGVEFKIKPADLSIQIQRTAPEAQGKYYVGVEASEDKGNTVTLKVKVNIGGEAEITAVNEVLGVGFKGVKTFDVSPNNEAQDIVLTPMSGKLIPKANDLERYSLDLNVNVKFADLESTINGTTVSLVVEPTELQLEATKTDFGKEPYYQGTAITDKHRVTVPVKVIGSGKATLKLKNSEGIEFEAKDVIFNKLDDANELQYVTFTPVKPITGKMPETATSDFTLTGEGARFKITGSKIVTFKLDKKPVGYTILCDKIKANRTAIPYNTEVGESYYINVPVNVTTPGEYEINTTGNADGITFSSTRADGVKKVFQGSGEQVVKLYAVNGTVKPTKKGEYALGIVTNDGSGNVGCTTFMAKVGFNDLKVLYYGAHYDDKGQTIGKFINGNNSKKPGTPRFGPKGTVVETGEISFEIFHYGVRKGSDLTTSDSYKPENRKALANRIKSGAYNLILLDGLYVANSFDADIQAALLEYIQKGGKTVMAIFAFRPWNNIPINTLQEGYAAMKVTGQFSEEYFGPLQNPNALQFYRDLNGGMDMPLNKETNFEYMKPAEDDTFIRGPYYDYGVGGTDYVFYHAEQNGGHSPFKTTGTKFDALVTINGDKDRASVVRHKEYKSLYWIIGTYSNNSPAIFTFSSFYSDNGEPRRSTTSYGNNRGPFMGNVLSGLIKEIANQ